MTHQLTIPDRAFFSEGFRRYEFQVLTSKALENHTFRCVAEFCGVADSTVRDWLCGKGVSPSYAQQTSDEKIENWIQCLEEIAETKECICRDEEKLALWRSRFHVSKLGMPRL